MPFLEFRRVRSEEHTSELQSHSHLVCRLLLEKKKRQHNCRLAPGTPASANMGAACGAESYCSHSPTYIATASLLPSLTTPFFFFFLNERAPPEISPFPQHAPLPT